MHRNLPYGWIDVIASGAMYAGKTTELIRRVRNFTFARRPVAVFQPAMSRRWDETHVVTHDGLTWQAVNVHRAQDILARVEELRPHCVAIDEAQFFDPDIVNVVQELANRGHHVVVAGLSQTSEGKPFGAMPLLLAIADQVTNVFGVCMVCGEPATKPFSLRPKTEDVSIGAADKYEARCRRCWLEGRRERGEVV